VIAARPGIGKSSFVTNVARNIAVDAGHPVGMFSLEMSRWEIGMRLLCGEARVPWDRIRNKRVGPEDWANIVQAAEVLHDAPLKIVDSGNVTLVDIRAKARRMRGSRRGLSLIIVDYLQLMSHHRRVDNRQQEVAEISRGLKLLAKELEIPVIAVSQLNRDPERRQDKKPQLADLRECVTGDTRVMLADGSRPPIRELVGTTPEVVALSPEGSLTTAMSEIVWQVGERPVFEVRLASGRSITATAGHRLFGDDGWVRLENLMPGARVAVVRRLPKPEHAVEWQPLRVALLGQLIGDGSYLAGQPMRYTTSSEENSHLVKHAVESEFGGSVKRYPGPGRWHQLLIRGNGNRWHPTGVNAWLRELGIFDQRSSVKRIPDEAFRLQSDQVAVLLRHLWATDGCISVRPAGQRGGHRVFFSTSSRRLAEDIAMLLLRLGIVGRIHKVGSDAGWYSVDVSGSRDQRLFLETVGAFGPRSEAAESLRHALENISHNTNVDTLPRLVFERVREAMRERGVSQRAMAARRGTAYGGTSHFRFSPSRELIADYARQLDDPGLRMWIDGEIFWDRVVAVNGRGSELVYDITVPGPANWVDGSSGIVSHNSGAIEQDSDVVMFIHRDDSDPNKRGLADLIVAKHRNGPTDTVPLTFLPHLTQFRDYHPGT
jgi:replicative DNA helicase